MSVLMDLPQAVIAAISAGLPDLRECREMEGRFDEGELSRVSTRTPAVLVARLGAMHRKPNPDWQMYGYTVKLAAFVVTKSDLATTGSAHLAVITEHLLGLIPEQDWDLDPVGPAQQVAEAPVVTAATRAKRVLITAITWEQPVALRAPVPGVPLAVEVYVSQAPEIGADHAGDYEQIGGEA